MNLKNPYRCVIIQNGDYMFADEKCVGFEIIDILRFRRKSIKYYTPKRDFAVISCRLFGESNFMTDNLIVHASPMEFVIIPAMCDYTQESTDEEIVCVHVRGDAFVNEITSFYSDSPKIAQLFLLAHKYWTKKGRGYVYICKSLVYNILYELINSGENNEASFISPSLEYIHAHFSDVDFDISDAIEKSFLSSAYFRRVFKNRYGMTPVTYVTKLRIDYAKSLIMTNGFSLKEISYMCGFKEEKYFFAVFKKLTGTTPSGWAESHIFE